jgi:hypothetical protein
LKVATDSKAPADIRKMWRNGRPKIAAAMAEAL